MQKPMQKITPNAFGLDARHAGAALVIVVDSTMERVGLLLFCLFVSFFISDPVQRLPMGELHGSW